MTVTADVKILKETIIEHIEKNKERYIDISHQIHARPEIGNQEFFASGLLGALLEEEGFTIERGAAGHETAFTARKDASKEGPVIGLLAEYDALPGLGHACGHNIIGTTSAAAAIGLSEVLEVTGGSVVVFGTPAEEGGPNGSAKGSFVKQGLTKGIDAFMMIHPGNETRLTGPTLAVDPLDFEFIGKPAHAAAAPEEGINALDGVIQLFNSINALRQHVPSDVRIHGIITHGGDAPNIVPHYAKARFFIRAASRPTLNDITAKVKAAAEGAALATGSKVNIIEFQNSIDDFLITPSFDRAAREVLEELGENVVLNQEKGLGSTDGGNISQVVPAIHPYIKIGPAELVGHTEEFREAAGSPKGDEALITGSKALALIGLRLLTEPDLLSSIKADYEKEVQKRKQ